jgi:ABC-2 type transport system permease protein
VIRQIRSELLKLRTARSFIVMIALGAVLAVVISVITAFASDYSHLSHGPSEPGVDQISTASVFVFFTLMLGVLTLTTEYRHGSIASTLLVEPNRRQLLVAKLVAVCAAGALVALLVGGICLALGAVILPGRGISLGLDGKLVAELLAGMTIAGALMAAIGLGIGALIRKQTAAVVGILVYLFLIEPLITQVALKSLERFSIGNALAQLTSTARVNGVDDAFGQVTGGLLLAGYAVVLVLVGAVVMQNRDVTD